MYPYPKLVDVLVRCAEELARGDGPAAYASFDTARTLVDENRSAGTYDALAAARADVVAAVAARCGDAGVAAQLAGRAIDGGIAPRLITLAG